MNINFENTYYNLPKDFYKESLAYNFSDPKLIFYNSKLATELQLPNYDEKNLSLIFSGQKILPNSKPIAMAYAGHQFGHFVPQLGDGRALLIGEIKDKNSNLKDIQLKGSGPTYFSRGGDGLAPLGPMLREYIVSEAMNALGVPTTRALALVTTGDLVYRENPLPGAVLTRVASSHVRVGTFEYFASRNDLKNLKILADYVISRHYPECKNSENPYLQLLIKIIRTQSQLISKWMSLGFIHGVMNTDNTTISGETIDYGPCAFMDGYNPTKVFSSIDRAGRYAFKNQPVIIEWNLSILASCLLPLILLPKEESFSNQEDFDEIKKLYTEKNIKIVQDEIDKFESIYKFYWLSEIKQKLGLKIINTENNVLNKDTFNDLKRSETDLSDFAFCEDFLNLLHKENIDFTLAFRYLSELLVLSRSNVSENQIEFSASTFDKSSFGKLFKDQAPIVNWIKIWFHKLSLIGNPIKTTATAMDLKNPLFIPRNHLIDKAIKESEIKNDFNFAKKILDLVTNPYSLRNAEDLIFSYPAKAEEQIYKTFCGT